LKNKNMKRFLGCLLAFVLLSCAKSIEDTVPYAPVSFRVNLLTWDSDLVGQLSCKIFTTARYHDERFGNAGVLVVCGVDNMYHAFDMCCPYEARKEITVKPTENGTAICPKCKTEYDTGSSGGTGIALEGPAGRRALRKLNVAYISQDELFISYR